MSILKYLKTMMSLCKFARTKDAVEKYNKLGATTKYYLHDGMEQK